MPFGLPSPPAFHHAPRTVLLHPKTPAATAAPTPLSAFVPPLAPTFYAHPLLFNGHLQTCYTAVKSADPFPVHYARRHLTNPNDGGHFAVDFAVDAFEPADTDADTDTDADSLPERTRHMPPDAPLASDDATPMLVALHGLSGGSHEIYLRAVLAPLVTAGSGGGEWAACVVNARGCAQSTITTKQLFNARFTEDLRVAVRYLTEAFPNRPLYAVGFSLGANILTHYLAEEGDKCVFRAAVVCSNPWNLELCCKNLHRTYLGRLYSRVMGENLKRLFEQHAPTLALPAAQVAAVRAGVLMDDFDRALTSKAFGYATVGAYYRHASSVDSLLRVRVPTLVVHARDDPIACDEAAPYDEVAANPWCVMVTTAVGGHLSWFELGGGRWFAGVVVAFLRRFESEVAGVVEPGVEEEEEEEGAKGV